MGVTWSHPFISIHAIRRHFLPSLFAVANRVLYNDDRPIDLQVYGRRWALINVDLYVDHCSDLKSVRLSRRSVFLFVVQLHLAVVP
jgi:hypothetical protein